MGTGASANVGECDAADGNDIWGYTLGCVVEVNEYPKSSALPHEIQKDDCHNGLLVRSLGITRWARESLKEDS